MIYVIFRITMMMRSLNYESFNYRPTMRNAPPSIMAIIVIT